MTSRRAFVAAAVAAPAAGQQEPEQPYRIDCQSHLYIPELLAFMEQRQESPRSYRKDGEWYVAIGNWVRRVLPKHSDVKAKLADMDAAKIQTTALSINDPGPELFGAAGPKVARLVNDGIAAIAREHPSRFFGLAVLPLQDMEASLVELERCADKLGFRGILLYSNLDGKWPDEPQFRPLFRRAEEMGVPVLLHPAYPMTFDVTKGYDLWGGLGLMFDTTIALARIILAGIPDRHPRLKLVCPHVGGALPYLVGRLDHQTQVLKRGAENIKRPPSEYLREIWFDCVSPLPLAIRYGYDFAGPDRLLFASDHPWVDPNLIAGCIRKAGLLAADERKIFSENARKLFRL